MDLEHGGSFKQQGASIEIILTTPEKYIIHRTVLDLRLPGVRNEAEYETFLVGLRMAITLGIS